MSGSDRTATGQGDGPEDQAGEYALGLLDEAERLAVERRLAVDPVLRAELGAWETRLAPLADLATPVTPPAYVWRRLLASIATPVRGSGSVAATRTGRFREDTRFWRTATAASLSLAAGLAVVVAVQHAQRVVGPAAALVPYGARDASFVAERRSDGDVALRPLGHFGVPEGRDLELWAAVPGRAAPVALGVLPASGRVLAASDIPQGTAKLLVSLEPKGGSPTGLPTGPVLFAGTVAAD